MTTFYIHPDLGSDGADGLSVSTAWKSFAPLAERQLGPGHDVKVLAAGDLRRTIHIRGHGTADAPITVELAPGRYDVWPDELVRRTYDISNTNDGRDIEKAIALLVDQARHVRVRSAGAKLVCRGKMIELCIDESEDVEISGLTFDYHRPTVSEFTVASATDESADLAVHQDSTYEVVDGAIRWVGEGWVETTGLAQELICETDEVWRRKDPLLGLRIEELQPGLLRAHGSHDMTQGRVFQLRNPYRDCVGAFLHRSRDVTLTGVRFAYMHGMGVLCQFTENITLDKVSIAPEEGSGRTTAAWADCAHFSGCRGTISVRDCLFCGAHDDAINIHGTYLRIIDKVDDRRLRVAFMHRQTFGFQAFYQGDEIDYVHADTLATFASARVESVEMLNPREQLLTLDQPVPPDWREEDVIENVTWTPSVRITGCTARRIPTRGFLVTTRRPVVIENNNFVRLSHGVQLELDANRWFESGCVRDMTIRGNQFLHGKRSAIRACPEAAAVGPAVNENIEIRDNEFVLTGKNIAVEAMGVRGLAIVENRIRPDAITNLDQLIDLSGCEDVRIEGNRLDQGDAAGG